MKDNKTKVIYKLLHKKYPKIKSALNFTNPVECWASVILSAQCTDKKVNQITTKLFIQYKTFKDYSEANIDELIEIIRPSGYFNSKAKYLIEGAKILVNNGYLNSLPSVMSELLKLPGIGRKTANVIFSNIHNINLGIAIDTHNIRILNRLGIVNTKNPEVIERIMMKKINRIHWKNISLLLVEHGRDICKARNPNCLNCSIKNHCEFTKKQNEINSNKNKKV